MKRDATSKKNFKKQHNFSQQTLQTSCNIHNFFIGCHGEKKKKEKKERQEDQTNKK